MNQKSWWFRCQPLVRANLEILDCIFVIQRRLGLFYDSKYSIEFFSVPPDFPDHRNLSPTLKKVETMSIHYRLEWLESFLKLSAKRRILRLKKLEVWVSVFDKLSEHEQALFEFSQWLGTSFWPLFSLSCSRALVVSHTCNSLHLCWLHPWY